MRRNDADGRSPLAEVAGTRRFDPSS